MLYALEDGEHRTARPQRGGKCPGCSGDLIAKCGEINAWHWAHRANDCDPWHEPESEWHIGWKLQDLGPRILELRRVHWDGRVGGWGLLRERRSFTERWLT